MRRLARTLGTLMILGGLGTLGWAVVVWQWQDPITAAYTHYQQNKLESRYRDVFVRYQPVSPPAEVPVSVDRPRTGRKKPSPAAQRRWVAREAKRYRLALDEGQPFAQLKVSRLGLSVIAVNGTTTDTLKKGPGRYAGPVASYVPGEGQLVYVAGHRTTYGAPFAHINRLRPGDPATVKLPYATFEYVITRHVIVESDDLSVLQSHGREVLALQACHPRFFASQRYIAYAKLVRVIPRGGRPYRVDGTRVAPA
ncbi:MAG: class D sortase [Actinobacteria bacterium]|nr:class D sortase [Actinomycetota bacterium]